MFSFLTRNSPSRSGMSRDSSVTHGMSH